MPRRLKGVLPYAALFIGAAYLFYDAATFAAAARPGQLGPDFWPRAVLVLLMIVCGIEILRALFDRGVVASTVPEPQPAHDYQAEAATRYPVRLVVGIALSIAYVLALDVLGFFVATALYLALFMVTGRYYRSRVVLLSSVLGSLAFVFVFMKIVYVSLPLGLGPFKVLSVWLLALLGIR